MKSLLILLTVFGFSTFASESQPATPAMTGESSDVDVIITNKRMRAETGAKSKWSIATAMGYSAGSIQKPIDEWRPNLSGATGSTDVTNLSGQISGKYNFSARTSLFAGIGLRWITPFQSSKVPSGYNGDKFDVDNPGLTFQYLYRWLGIQSAFTLNETFYTATNLQRDGYVTAWSIAQSNLYEIGSSGITFGLSPYFNVAYYDDDSARAKANQSDYAFGVTPMLEYRLTDKINLRTDTNIAAFQHLRSAKDSNTYLRHKVVQGFSVGYALTRDIYLSPGVQWIPADIRADRTTTWLSAYINVY